MIGKAILSPVVREINIELSSSFKDSYVFEFLNLSDPHNESDLQKGQIKQMKAFILELSKDFIFIDEESIEVINTGNQNIFNTSVL